MNIDKETKRFIINRLKCVGLYFGISFLLLIFLPFPYDFISVLGIFVLVNYLRGRSVLRRYGGMKEMFALLSSSVSSNDRKPLKYYCMNRGNEHKEIACPNCGSKMKRVGYDFTMNQTGERYIDV
jgi:hypothetical protein